MTIRSNGILTRRKIALTVQRYDIVLVDHEYVLTPLTPFTASANPRPLNDKETQFLPEGESANSFRIFDTSTKLRTADDKINPPITADEIHDYIGFKWRIVGEKPWGRGTRHNQYTIQKFEAA